MQIGVANSGAELTSMIGDNRAIHDNRSGVSRVKLMYWEIRNKFRSTIPGRTHRSPDGTPSPDGSRRQMGTRPLDQYRFWCIARGAQPCAKRGVIIGWRA